MAINSVSLTGNLGQDGEIRTTANGYTVLKFSLAVNERQKQEDGSYSDYTNWFTCKLFGKRAEALSVYLTRGTKVSVQGKLHYSSWENREDGRKMNRIEILVDEIELCGGRSEAQSPAPTPAPTVENADEDIPF